MKFDWEILSRSLRLQMGALLDLFKDPDELEQKLKQPRHSVGKIQQDQTKPHGGKQ